MPVKRERAVSQVSAVVSSAPSAKRAKREAGILKKVTFKNFMCHKNFSLDFKSGMTILTGDNGSGKSTAMCGIMLALGAGQKAVDRGTLEAMVAPRVGAAEITITLNNEGPDGFHMNGVTVGDEITITRRITRSEAQDSNKPVKVSTDYTIRGANGDVLGKKKSLVDSITSHFNIQPDNPSMFLTQDASKQYLKSAKPKDLYELFTKGSLLDDTLHQYDLTAAECERNLEKLHREMEGLNEEKVEMNECRKLLAKADNLQKSRDKLQILVGDLAWAAVIEKTKEYQKQCKQSELERKKIHQLEEFIEKCRGDIKQAEKDLAAERDMISGDDMKRVNEHIRELERDFEESTLQLKVLQRKRAEKLEHAQDLDRKTDNMRAQIADIQKEMQSHVNEDTTRLAQQLTDFEKEKQAYSAKISATSDKLKQVTVLLTDHKKSEHEIRSSVNLHEGEIIRLKNVIRTMQAPNTVGKVLPPRWEQMLDEIARMDREGKWSKCPIGPLGLVLNVDRAHTAWGGAAELYLRNELMKIVATRADASRLRDLLRRYQLEDQSQIQIRENYFDNVYPYDRNRVGGSDYKLLIDILEVDAEFTGKYAAGLDKETIYATAINVLIDQGRIESVILASTREEQSAIGKRFESAIILAKDGTKSVHSKSAVVDEIPGKGQMSTRFFFPRCAPGEQAEKLREQLANHQNELEALQSKAGELSQERQRIEGDRNRLVKEQKALEVDHSRLAWKAEDVQRQLQDTHSVTQRPTDVTETLQQSLSQMTDEAAKDRKYASALDSEVNEKAEIVKEKKRDLDKAKRERAERTKAEQSAQERIQESLEGCKKMKGEFDKAVESRRKLVAEAIPDEKLKNTFAEITKAKEGALKIAGDERAPKASASELKDTINALQQIVAQGKEEIGDMKALHEEFETKQREYKRKQGIIEANKNACQIVLEGVKKRRRGLRNLYRIMADTTTKNFQIALTQFSMNGSIDWNHDEKKAELKATKIGPGSGESGNVRMLSGGEGSFTSLCFFIAMWGLTETPIRMMDEMDVYMDPVLKTKSYKVVNEIVDQNQGKQFICLTPNECSYVMPHTTKLKMPSRGNRQITEYLK